MAEAWMLTTWDLHLSEVEASAPVGDAESESERRDALSIPEKAERDFASLRRKQSLLALSATLVAVAVVGGAMFAVQQSKNADPQRELAAIAAEAEGRCADLQALLDEGASNQALSNYLLGDGTTDDDYKKHCVDTFDQASAKVAKARGVDHADDVDPEPEPREEVPPPSDAEISEAAFMIQARIEVPIMNSVTDDKLVELGYAICGDLSDGHNVYEVSLNILALSAAYDANMNETDGAALVGAATGSMCEEYAYQWK
jgi:hypothetical protein